MKDQRSLSHSYDTLQTMQRAQRPGAAARLGDRLFRLLTCAAGLSVLGLIVAIGGLLLQAARPALTTFGWRFLVTADWDPAMETFGALPFLYGTIVSASLALLIALPLGLGAAMYLAELAPAWLQRPLVFLVELLAAVPSVVYGLWGIFVLAPWLRTWLQPPLAAWLGWLPLFQGPPLGIGMLTAGLLLAIMIIPLMTAVSREVLLAVPTAQREAALALGATRWEAIRIAVLPYGRAGLVGAGLLGLGRALGETMAVTMVIGNRPEIAWSLFAPSATMASVLANEFTEATSDLHLAALTEIGLLLLCLTVFVNALARLLIWSISGPGREVHA